MATKIFVRERRKVQKGEKKPRFRVVGVSGSDVKIHANHLRKKELDQLQQEAGVSIVYMASGNGKMGGGGQSKS